MSSPSPTPHQASASRARGADGWVWIVIVAGLLLAIAIAAAGAFVYAGWELFSNQAKTALQDNATVAEHIGTIREMELDLVATGNSPGAEEFAFRLQGDRGRGLVIAEFESTAEAEKIVSGMLTLSNGRKVPLEVAPSGE